MFFLAVWPIDEDIEIREQPQAVRVFFFQELLKSESSKSHEREFGANFSAFLGQARGAFCLEKGFTAGKGKSFEARNFDEGADKVMNGDFRAGVFAPCFRGSATGALSVAPMKPDDPGIGGCEDSAGSGKTGNSLHLGTLC